MSQHHFFRLRSLTDEPHSPIYEGLSSMHRTSKSLAVNSVLFSHRVFFLAAKQAFTRCVRLRLTESLQTKVWFGESDASVHSYCRSNQLASAVPTEHANPVERKYVCTLCVKQAPPRPAVSKTELYLTGAGVPFKPHHDSSRLPSYKRWSTSCAFGIKLRPVCLAPRTPRPLVPETAACC